MKLRKFFGMERRCGALFILIAVILAGASCRTRMLSQGGGQAGMTNNREGAAVNYVALGDSTGVGVGAEHGGYAIRLLERIKQERPQSRLTNLCVSGATTDDVLREQVGQVAAVRPTLVTLGIGINDAGRSFPVDSFARNYEEIVKRLRSSTDAPIVVSNLPDVSLAPVVPAYLRGEVRRRIELYNERISEIAGRYGLRVVDAFTATREVIPRHPEFFSSDGFHPSDVGYEYWAKTMWPTVKAAIGQ
jgi:acyl-CoA thioesterase I